MLGATDAANLPVGGGSPCCQQAAKSRENTTVVFFNQERQAQCKLSWPRSKYPRPSVLGIVYSGLACVCRACRVELINVMTQHHHGFSSHHMLLTYHRGEKPLSPMCHVQPQRPIS
jgi:hypothetical protein